MKAARIEPFELDFRPVLSMNCCRLPERLLNVLLHEIQPENKHDACRPEKKHQDQCLVVARIRRDAGSPEMNLDLQEDTSKEDDEEQEACGRG